MNKAPAFAGALFSPFYVYNQPYASGAALSIAPEWLDRADSSLAAFLISFDNYTFVL